MCHCTTAPLTAEWPHDTILAHWFTEIIPNKGRSSKLFPAHSTWVFPKALIHELTQSNPT